MAYKLMVIDDAQDRRKQQYAQVLSVPEFETLYIWTRHDFERHRDTPVDGYIIDVFWTVATGPVPPQPNSSGMPSRLRHVLPRSFL